MLPKSAQESDESEFLVADAEEEKTNDAKGPSRSTHDDQHQPSDDSGERRVANMDVVRGDAHGRQMGWEERVSKGRAGRGSDRKNQRYLS